MDTTKRIAIKLKLNAKESAYFYELVDLESEKDPEAKAIILERIRILHPKKRTTQDLNIEHFKQMSEWYHSAILELPAIKHFEFTPDNVAKALKIPKPQADMAIERLLKLGLL